MRSYPLNEARAEFSKVVERALAGEPQRITSYGKEAVIIVAESTWREHRRRAATLGDLLANFAEAEGGEDELFRERLFVQEKSLGADFVRDE